MGWDGMGWDGQVKVGMDWNSRVPSNPLGSPPTYARLYVTASSCDTSTNPTLARSAVLLLGLLGSGELLRSVLQARFLVRS